MRRRDQWVSRPTGAWDSLSGGPLAASEGSGVLEITDYLRSARKHWRSIAAIVLVCVIAGGAFSLLSKPTYTASTSLFVAVKSVNSTGELNAGTSFAENQVQSFARVARTPIVLQPVIDSLGLGITADKFAERVTATVPVNTATLDVAIVDSDPVRAATIANAVGERLVTVVRELSPPSPTGGETVAATIIRPATAPTSPTTPKPAQNLALGLFLGLLLGAGQAILRDTLDTKIRTEHDIEQVTECPVIGSIMWDPSLTPKSAAIAESQSLRAESYRRLRTNLQFLGLEEGHRAIVVTSSVASEGKTTTAINIAATMAAAGDRVLLVDADLRRPRVASALGLEGAAGLTTILIGQASAADVVQPQGVGRFDVIASGPIPPNPSELLGFPEMKEFLRQAAKSYDMVILDAPPVLPVTDAAVLSRIASGAVVVAGSRVANKAQLASALQTLERVEARILGIVLNKVHLSDQDGYGYGYGYSYEYGSQSGQPAPVDPMKPRRSATSEVSESATMKSPSLPVRV